MNQEQTNITTGKQIRHLRTQLGMTQEELAGELNVTRQALSNWERDVNEPDLNMLKKICFLFGVNMDDFAKEVITKMETYEKKLSEHSVYEQVGRRKLGSDPFRHGRFTIIVNRGFIAFIKQYNGTLYKLHPLMTIQYKIQ